MFVRFQFKSTTFAELVRDQIARSDVGCIKPTGSGFVVERIEFPPAGSQPMDVDQSGGILENPNTSGAATISTEPWIIGQADIVTEATSATQPTAGSRSAPAGTIERIHLPLPGSVWGDAFETITVPVVGGSPISVRRRRLLLTLPVTLTIRSLANVIANTGEPLVVTIDIRLHVDMVHRPDGKDYVRVEFDGVGHREGNDPAIEGLIRTELAGTNVGREVEFEYTAAVLRAVNSMGGGGQVPTVAWSGMSLSPDRQAVELRVEVTFDNATGTAFPDEWQRFLTRQADDFRTGHDWAVEITNQLLDVTATAGAHDQVSNQSGFDLAGGGPYVEWRPDYPGFRTTFTGEIIDACSCFGVDIDLNVSVEVTTKLRLAEGGPNPTIEVDTVAEGDATHAGEQACCAITGTMFFPILGWKYLAEGKIGWGGLALGMFVPVVGSFITMWQLFDPTPQVPVPEGCRKDGDHQICSYQLPLDPPIDPCNPASASISLDLLRGRNNGLVLAGAVHQTYRSAPQVAASRPTPFEWHGPTPTCTGPQGEWSAQSGFTVTQIDGGFPLEVCDAIAVGPTAPIYRPHIWHTTDCPSTADILVTTVPWTPGNPNPAPILVLTNVGATLVMVPPLPALSDDEKRAHDRLVAIWQRRHCKIFDPGSVSSNGNVLSRWLVEPPPDDEPSRHLWVIRAGGLDEGELLVLSDAEDGEVLATAASDARRGVRIDLLHDGDGVQITRRLADGSPGGPLEDATVTITQLLLEQIDVHQLDEPAEGLRPTGPPSRAAVEVDLADRSELVRVRPGGRMERATKPGWSAPAEPGPLDAIRSARAPAPPRRTPTDEVRELAARVRRSGDVDDDSSLQIAPTSNSWRWIVDGGSNGFVEIDERAARVMNRFRDRPWFDGMVYAGGVWARLDDDRTILRTYRVRDSVSL